MSGDVKIDGSSTVYPITKNYAEEFRAVQPNVKVTVGVSGTGGGFKKFSRGETSISNASRPIKDSEAAKLVMKTIYPTLDYLLYYDGLQLVLINQRIPGLIILL